MTENTSTIPVVNVIKALQIDGFSKDEALKVLELARRVERLKRKETLIRAGDLTKEHVGQLLSTGYIPGRVLNDIEVQPVRRGMAFGMTTYQQIGSGRLATVDEAEFDGDEDIPRGRRTVTVVLDSKIVRLKADALVTLTETRDV